MNLYQVRKSINLQPCDELQSIGLIYVNITSKFSGVMLKPLKDCTLEELRFVFKILVEENLKGCETLSRMLIQNGRSCINGDVYIRLTAAQDV